MKKTLLVVLILLSTIKISAQTIEYHDWGKSVGNTIIVDKFLSTDFDTVYITSYVYAEGEVLYPIFISKNGTCFIYKIDRKSNKPYKLVLPEETSRYIRNKMRGRIEIEGEPKYRK